MKTVGVLATMEYSLKKKKNVIFFNGFMVLFSKPNEAFNVLSVFLILSSIETIGNLLNTITQS